MYLTDYWGFLLAPSPGERPLHQYFFARVEKHVGTAAKELYDIILLRRREYRSKGRALAGASHKRGREEMHLEKELVDAFDRVVHQDHPNRNRTKCPGSALLQKLASHPEEFQSASTLAHVRHCAPCLDELKRLRRSFKRKKYQEPPNVRTSCTHARPFEHSRHTREQESGAQPGD